VSTLLDEKTMQLVYSKSNTLHVKAWFSKTACGKDCWDHHNWESGGFTSLRWIAKIAQVPQANRFCKSCARIYKDVNVNG
jgi:hypothetical protein